MSITQERIKNIDEQIKEQQDIAELRQKELKLKEYKRLNRENLIKTILMRIFNK